ncbi:MAG: tRNA (adenosine(37)-N6)-threonylcarbamoyltransferase complex dimerization subunit type 1 TsaB [Gammaproteobacteria bacterium]|nr:tRNA (adenosine(37)-N6)-threonylcarbamoyltransferase complex dimerization subunit type 1 TsaB [Gammaproteobacteria bacterium]MBU1625691.1 tRNA (adenosine(37)-N6)-threonylcarbamoyltransferase complex dimerization subunit type 1 TsaB [Gammaproteobacteria bacterium]MBU1980951.1 tRNA (adenosine(37)-N6)-threonylcarbamoyltransferase complex dimerization subunit type 1 TsaB [Gammaproteobacteria bacterium]
MKLLAIETSTEYCSVALWQDGVVSARSERVGQKHSEVLMAMVDAVLKDAGCKIKEVDGIAFGKGPGSFTGVRIACGVAQGLAFGVDVNVVGVCTLQALAEAAGKDKVIAALDARMGELYLAAYQKQGDVWQTVVAPCLCKAEEAPIIDGEGWFGCGSGFAVSEMLQQRYAAHMDGVDAQAVPLAEAVVKLAAVEFKKGNAVDAALALPLYLRDKVALTTREREDERSTSTSSVRTVV